MTQESELCGFFLRESAVPHFTLHPFTARVPLLPPLSRPQCDVSSCAACRNRAYGLTGALDIFLYAGSVVGAGVVILIFPPPFLNPSAVSPPEKKTCGELMIQSTKSGGGAQFLLLDCMAKAPVKGSFFTDTGVSPLEAFGFGTI